MGCKQIKSIYIEVLFFQAVCDPSSQYDRWRVLMSVLFSTIGPRDDVQPVVAPTSFEGRSAMKSGCGCRPTFQFETLTSAAQDCDVIVVATAPQVAARSVAEKLGIPWVFAAYARWCYRRRIMRHRPCHPNLGRAPPTTDDNSELWAKAERRKV
jgi:vancomycin aglycone glucosyltransferase